VHVPDVDARTVMMESVSCDARCCDWTGLDSYNKLQWNLRAICWSFAINLSGRQTMETGRYATTTLTVSECAPNTRPRQCFKSTSHHCSTSFLCTYSAINTIIRVTGAGRQQY